MEREQLIQTIWNAMKDGPELAAVECDCPHKKMRIIVSVIDKVIGHRPRHADRMEIAKHSWEAFQKHKENK